MWPVMWFHQISRHQVINKLCYEFTQNIIFVCNTNELRCAAKCSFDSQCRSWTYSGSKCIGWSWHMVTLMWPVMWFHQISRHQVINKLCISVRRQMLFYSNCLHSVHGKLNRHSQVTHDVVSLDLLYRGLSVKGSKREMWIGRMLLFVLWH
jgi:hypothetical protein